MSFDSRHPLNYSSKIAQAVPWDGSKSAVSLLSPWNLFDSVWKTAMGYRADDFRFVEGKTPMSTFTESLVMIMVYLVVVFGGRELMKNREPMKLNTLFKIHNFGLTMLSGGLLILFLEQLVPQIWAVGLYQNICGAPGWTRPLVTLYYLNYLTKYVELLDTVFLVVKKKPLTFLHCYHHPATALLCYTQLIGHTSVSWVPITLNLTVHVVMYWYYYQSACGRKVSWKQWITRMQIGQFVLDLGFVYFACWDYFASQHYPWLPHIGPKCSGSGLAALMGCCILSSYLVLFVMFYINTYRKGAARKARQNVKTAAVKFAAESSSLLTEGAGNTNMHKRNVYLGEN